MCECTFILSYIQLNGQPIERDEFPLFLTGNDIVKVRLGDEEFPFQLQGQPAKWYWPKGANFPDLVLGVLNIGLKMGLITSFVSEGPPITYVIQGYSDVPGCGRVPIGIQWLEKRDCGDTIQLWTGHILGISPDGHLHHYPRAWLPGRDGTPPQKSRCWEE